MSHPPARCCEDVVKATGLPCPTQARRVADADGRFRCRHHSHEPVVRAAVRTAQLKGAFRTMELIHRGPPVVPGERYTTAQALDVLVDETLNTLRLGLRERKTPKPALAQAIATMIETKLKLVTYGYAAAAQRRLNPARETPA